MAPYVTCSRRYPMPLGASGEFQFGPSDRVVTYEFHAPRSATTPQALQEWQEALEAVWPDFEEEWQQDFETARADFMHDVVRGPARRIEERQQEDAAWRPGSKASFTTRLWRGTGSGWAASAASSRASYRRSWNGRLPGDPAAAGQS